MKYGILFVFAIAFALLAGCTAQAPAAGIDGAMAGSAEGTGMEADGEGAGAADEGAMQEKEASEKPALNIKSCRDDDGACPEICNAIKDNDCPVHRLESEEQAEDGVLVTLANARRARCQSLYDSPQKSYDYGSYIYLDLTAQNGGEERAYFFPPGDFYLLDGDGNRYPASPGPPGKSCGFSNVLGGEYLEPGDLVFGELWLKTAKEGEFYPKGKLWAVYDPLNGDGDELIFEFEG